MIVVSVLQFAQVAVLARMLPATDFGLMAMIAVVIAFGTAYADMGLSNAVIYRQDATRDQLSSLYWLNVLAGGCVFGTVVALSPVIADFFREPRLARLLPLAGLLFVITPFGQQFQMLLERSLRFRLLGAVDVCGASIGAATAITCALAGLGVVSLIVGQLANTGLRTAILAAVGWRTSRPRLHFRWRDTRGYVSFGLYQMGERSINQLSANLDYLIIGRVLGPAVLGPYSLAYQLAVMPMLKLNPVLTRVAFPAFAMRQSDLGALRRGYARISGLLVFAVYPFVIGLIVLAPVVVPVFYGDRWQAAVPLVQVLGLMALLKTLSNPSGSVMLAIGRANVGFWMNLGVTLAAAVSFLIAASHGGAIAVAWTWVGIAALALSVVLLLLHRLIGLTLRQYLAELKRPLALVVLLGLIVAAAYWILSAFISGSVVLLMILVGLGVVAYLVLWRVADRSFVGNLLRAFLGRNAEAL